MATSTTIPAPAPPVGYLLTASAVALALSVLPFANVVTYPFLIFATFIHETFHALAAILTLGSVKSLTVRWDGSGLTYTRGGIQTIVSSAGYVGTALFGGLLLVLSRNPKFVRPALAGCALLVATVTALFAGYASNLVVLAALALIIALAALSRGAQTKSARIRSFGLAAFIFLLLLIYLLFTRSLFSWAVGLLTTMAFLGVLRFVSPSFTQFFLSFLAVQCSFNSLEAVRALYFASLRATCSSDAQTMTALTGIPALFWAILWAGFAITVLILSLLLYLRKRANGQS